MPIVLTPPIGIILVMTEDYASRPQPSERTLMGIQTVSLRIGGRVQGVGYRRSMCAQALALGLTGWVRNRRDGSVEALVRGPENVVSSLVEWAWHGPPAAHVTSVERDAGDESLPLDGFEQLPTV